MNSESLQSKLVPWFHSHWHNLHQQVRASRLPHAMLWVSPTGIGTKEVAARFLQYLMCENKQSDQACGVCNHCQLFQAQTHPDFHYLGLQEKSKNISIEQVRTLIDKLAERPHQGGKRLVLVEPAEQMNRASANAFLKTLEEPGDDTILILLTYRIEAIPATIRSRCQTLYFHAPEQQQAFNYLQQLHPDNTTVIEQALSLTQNRPYAALDLIESGKLQSRLEFFAYLEALSQGRLDPVALANEYNTPELIIERCDWLFTLLSDAEKHAAGLSKQLFTNSDQETLITGLNKIPIEVRNGWLNKVLESKKLMLQATNVNPTLTMESLMIGWIAISSN